MSFLEDMHLHHESILDTLDGRLITYTPYGSAPRAISGMLQEFTEMIHGESIDINSTRPILSVRSDDVPDIQTGDMIDVEGANYQVEVIQPDSEGITELVLERL